MFKIPISSLKDVISFIKPTNNIIRNKDGIPEVETEYLKYYYNTDNRGWEKVKTRCFVKYLYGDEAYSTSETTVKKRIDFYVRNRGFLRYRLDNSYKIDYNAQIFDIIYINFLGEFIEIRGECNYEITNYGT